MSKIRSMSKRIAFAGLLLLTASVHPYPMTPLIQEGFITPHRVVKEQETQIQPPAIVLVILCGYPDSFNFHFLNGVYMNVPIDAYIEHPDLKTMVDEDIASGHWNLFVVNIEQGCA